MTLGVPSFSSLTAWDLLNEEYVNQYFIIDQTTQSLEFEFNLII